MPHGWGWYAPGWGWGIAMMVGMALFWILILAGLVLLIRWVAMRSAGGGALLAGGPSTESALEVLKRRYASGDIGRDEFERMKQDIA